VTLLTVLMVTRGDPHARRFVEYAQHLADRLGCWFLLGCDGEAALELADAVACWRLPVSSNGAIESVLDTCVAACSSGYVLRLDDDESCSPELADWLVSREWETHDHWAFPRRNLFPDESSFITSDPLWPDCQTRLSVRAKAGGRTAVHAGSPYGTGRVCPHPIDHHKYIVRDQHERAAIADRYERIQPGAGTGHYRLFSLPEEHPNLEIAVTAGASW
jgi:hypothetical protein